MSDSSSAFSSEENVEQTGPTEKLESRNFTFRKQTIGASESQEVYKAYERGVDAYHQSKFDIAAKAFLDVATNAKFIASKILVFDDLVNLIISDEGLIATTKGLFTKTYNQWITFLEDKKAQNIYRDGAQIQMWFTQLLLAEMKRLYRTGQTYEEIIKFGEAALYCGGGRYTVPEILIRMYLQLNQLGNDTFKTRAFYLLQKTKHCSNKYTAYTEAARLYRDFGFHKESVDTYEELWDLYNIPFPSPPLSLPYGALSKPYIHYFGLNSKNPANYSTVLSF